jgi:hypothetical protein
LTVKESAGMVGELVAVEGDVANPEPVALLDAS